MKRVSKAPIGLVFLAVAMDQGLTERVFWVAGKWIVVVRLHVPPWYPQTFVCGR